MKNMERPVLIHADVKTNTDELKRRFQNSFDLTVRELTVGGMCAAAAVLEGMYSDEIIAETVLKPLTNESTQGKTALTEYELEARLY
jgi:hypothetical protein